MGTLKVTIPQIADDEDVERIDAFLSGLDGWVVVIGNIEDRALGLRVAGYRLTGQRPLHREPDPEQPGADFERTHYNSMTFEFEREAEARDFHERFG